MNQKIVRAIAEYVPLVAGFTLLVNNQIVAGSAFMALYVPINQVNRRHEIAQIGKQNIPDLDRKDTQSEPQLYKIEQYNTGIVQIGQQLAPLSQTVKQQNAAIAQIGQQLRVLSPTVKQHNTAIVQLNQQLIPLSQTVEQHNTNITQIGQKLTPLSQTVEQHNTEIQTIHQQLDDILGAHLDADMELLVAEIKQLLQNTLPQYEPLYDRHDSHKVLQYALQEARMRVIMVCPWLNWDVINRTKIYDNLQNKLNNNVKIDILYGYQEDVERLRTNRLEINRWNLLKAARCDENAWRYDAIEELSKLEKQHQGKFNLRLIGTHEKILVCDEKLAMVGSHNFLTSYPSNKREFGLKTTDKNIINGLLERFENARNLEKDVLNS